MDFLDLSVLKDLGEALPYAATAAYVVAVVVIAWLSVRVLRIGGGAVTVSLLFAPLLAFLIFSDQLAEILGMGFGTRFIGVGATPVAELAVGADATPLAGPVGPDAAVGPVLLLGPGAAPSRREAAIERALAIGRLIYRSLLDGTFRALVVIDAEGRVVGGVPRDRFLDLLRIPFIPPADTDLKLQFLRNWNRQQIELTRLWVILADPPEAAAGSGTLVAGSDTAAQALAALRAAGVSLAVVVDDDGRYAGVVTASALSDRLTDDVVGAMGPGGRP